jgi:release factor glutamine methyltransferase
MPSHGISTVGGAMRDAAVRLEAAGLSADEARIDARVLARHAFGLDEAGLILREIETAPPDALTSYESMIARRATREPVAYILGGREFYGRDFEVTPAVLIPRPETELIVELALARFRDRSAPLEMADVGTGSGCLAVTLACELPSARVFATDVSLDAITVARRNATRHGVADRVVFLHASLVPPVQQVDMVVSNPPYVPSVDRETLQADVRDHEPALALFGGQDGLDVLRGLVTEAAGVLRESGWLIVEFGFGQAEAVQQWLDEDGRYTDITIANDLQGIARVVCARLRSQY